MYILNGTLNPNVNSPSTLGSANVSALLRSYCIKRGDSLPIGSIGRGEWERGVFDDTVDDSIRMMQFILEELTSAGRTR